MPTFPDKRHIGPKNINVYFDAWARLEEVARELKRSQADIVREAIDQWLERHDEAQSDRPKP